MGFVLIKSTRFILPQFRGPLVHNQPRTLALQFSSQNLGRFEDRLEITFRDDALSQQFVISRSVRAVVANQRELDALGPTTPFRRPPRRRFIDRGVGDVEGVRYPFPSDIIWVAKLAQYAVPDSIQRALASGKPEDQLRMIQTSILPPQVTSQTYARQWSALLHMEEVQMT